MRSRGTSTRDLARLDSAVDDAIADESPPILAFSGGLASLVIAAFVRKRSDLKCVVVGTPRSADVEAATVAHAFLDYPVSVLRPTPPQSLRAACSLMADHPRLYLHEVLSLVPLALAEERYRPRAVISGFGLMDGTAAFRRVLASRGPCPGLRLRKPGPTRARLVRMAESIGIPESFIRAAPRKPIEGSGIGPVLRGMAHSRRVSLARLLAADDVNPDYQKRPLTPAGLKSSRLD